MHFLVALLLGYLLVFKVLREESIIVKFLLTTALTVLALCSPWIVGVSLLVSSLVVLFFKNKDNYVNYSGKESTKRTR